MAEVLILGVVFGILFLGAIVLLHGPPHTPEERTRALQGQRRVPDWALGLGILLVCLVAVLLGGWALMILLALLFLVGFVALIYYAVEPFREENRLRQQGKLPPKTREQQNQELRDAALTYLVYKNWKNKR